MIQATARYVPSLTRSSLELRDTIRFSQGFRRSQHTFGCGRAGPKQANRSTNRSEAGIAPSLRESFSSQFQIKVVENLVTIAPASTVAVTTATRPAASSVSDINRSPRV